MNNNENNNSSDEEQNEEPMDTFSWILVSITVVVLVISLIVKFNVSGFLGFN